jgi:putative protein-disulfide isomerase
METNRIESMTCNTETGLCEIPVTENTVQETDISATTEKIRLLYFTDPICSSCWGIEPQLRKLKLEYGEYFKIEYRTGGLLKSWDSYGGSDVGKPTDVAVHWEEASDHYQMPIDGDVWLEDPLDSSYPPSIAFKAAQMQGEDKAELFLRKIKEMVFLEKKNISKWGHLEQAALATGLDIVKLKADFDGAANTAFDDDLTLARQLGVRGFPTIFFTDKDDNRFKVYGSKPYEVYEQALLKLYPDAVKKSIDTSLMGLFEHYSTLTTKEAAVLTAQTFEEAEASLKLLNTNHKISRYDSKKGPLWSKN